MVEISACTEFANSDGFKFLAPNTPYFSIQVVRLSVFILLLGHVWRKRRQILRSHSEEGTPTSGTSFLLLPAYFDFLRLFIFYIFTVTVVNLSSDYSSRQPLGLALQIGVFHFFYDGLWFFFGQYGAGSKAFIRASWFGFFSAALTTFTFTAVARNLRNADDQKWFPVILSYSLAYAMLFGLPLIIPAEYLYRRPPMVVYSSLMCAYHVLYCIFVVLVHSGENSGYCLAVSVYILFDCILKPLCVVTALAIDSAYWQGTDSAHPLAGIWSVDATLATSIANIDTRHLRVPFVHFGLISLDKDVGFVAGGFSRVYFGKIRDTKVALKMLFVMELTPSSISNFCREADIIYNLRHPNIISCLGVCIMPPAVSIVLEYCALGSLYDVIYKPRTRQSGLFGQSLRATFLRTRNISLFTSHTRSSIQSNSTSEQDQYELRPSAGYRARGSDVSVKSTNNDNLQTPMNNNVPSSSMESLQNLSPNTLHYESRMGLTAAWETLSVLCEASDEHFPFDLDPSPLTDTKYNISSYATNARTGLEPSIDIFNARPFDTETRLLISPALQRRSCIGLWQQHLKCKPYYLTEPDLEHGDDSRESSGVDNQESSGSRFTSLFQRSSTYVCTNTQTAIADGNNNNNLSRTIYDPPPRTQHGSEFYRTDIPIYLLEGLPLIHNLSVRGLVEVLCDIARGLAFLHHRGIMHCDVKSLNFLVAENFRVKLADFGESKIISTVVVGDSRPPVPALNWCPPEVIHPGATASSYTPASDVFGMAMVFTEVLMLALPLDHLRFTRKTYEVWRTMLLSGIRPDLPPNLPRHLKTILQAAWASDPCVRPTAEDVLQVLETILAIIDSRILPGINNKDCL